MAMKQLTVGPIADNRNPPGDHSMVAEKKRAICFTLWFRTHNNPRYADLFPRLTDVVQFRKLTLSDRRFVRGLQFRLWKTLRENVFYPAIARYIADGYPTVFTVDTRQIPAWPKTQRVVVDVDDPVFDSTEIETLKLPQVKAIVVTTEQARAIYRGHGITCPIHVIRPGVSIEAIDPCRAEEIRQNFKRESDVIIAYHAPTLTLSCDWLGRARDGQDDLDFLFAAFEKARGREPLIKLWLFGQASASVKEYVAERQARSIKIFGYIPFSDLLNYIASVDIGVYPRTWVQPPGRFNVKLAQFMACGIPVVSTDLDESFIVRETGCGIVCKSQEDFAQALVGLAQSAEKRAELGNAGRIYAKTNLDWSVLVPIYRDILNEVDHGS
ncbi:MAG: glycosyltransferase [Deltaproteobacteria bacterium]|nr:glycosyltransferase [Deltaproteobacteria bacterium]